MHTGLTGSNTPTQGRRTFGAYGARNLVNLRGCGTGVRGSGAGVRDFGPKVRGLVAGDQSPRFWAKSLRTSRDFVPEVLGQKSEDLSLFQNAAQTDHWRASGAVRGKVAWIPPRVISPRGFGPKVRGLVAIVCRRAAGGPAGRGIKGDR